MTFFGNILASSYSYYSRKKKIDVSFQSKLVVVYIQYMSILVLLFVLNEYFKIPVFTFFSKYKLLVIIFFGTIFWGTFKYYSKEKINSCIKNFKSKSLGERRAWAFVTGLMPVLPFILFFLIMRMRHPV